MEQAILYSFLAGVVGTGLGGLLACHMGGKQQDLAGLLYFTAGVMMGMAFFDLLPEAVEHSPLWLVGLGLLGGAGFVSLAEGVEHMAGGLPTGRGARCYRLGLLLYWR